MNNPIISWRRKDVWGWFAVMIGAIVVVTTFLGLFTEANGMLIGCVATIAYTVLSFRRFGGGEAQLQGALIRLGKAVGNLEADLHFIPLGIFWIKTFPTTVIQEQFPGDSREIWWNNREARPEGNSPLGEGHPWLLPIRATTLGKSGGNDPLTRSMTIDYLLAIWYRINDPMTFFNRSMSLEKLSELLEDTLVSKAQHEIQKRTFRKVLLENETIDERLKREADSATDELGVEIRRAQLLEPHPPREVSEALRSAAAAMSNKEAVIRTAEGKKQQLALEGEGRAHATIAEGKAEAKALKALIQKATESEGGLDVYVVDKTTEAVRNANSTIIVGPEGVKQLAGLLGATFGGVVGNRSARENRSQNNREGERE